jgi:hypothetical protein
MPELCQNLSELAPELVRGRALEPALEAHVATCAECARVVSGARALGQDLASVEAAPPPSDLVARTLARVRLAAVATPSMEPARPKRKTAAEFLETWALPGPVPQVTPARGRIWGRLAIQAAAAVLLFACCTVFTLEFYPAYVEALEERHVHGCQEHLQTIAAAIERYAKDHPEAAKLAEPLQGLALRDALVRGGYASEEDFLCPSVRGARPGALCYFLRLPDGRPGPRPVAWDRFGNHGGGALNVVRDRGSPELLEGERLWQWLSGGRE